MGLPRIAAITLTSPVSSSRRPMMTWAVVDTRQR
jgi:hypothetical protein